MQHDGDLILFQGKTVQQRCLRCITKATYDHVAIVIKNHGSRHNFRVPKTSVLEATGAGVKRYDLHCWCYARGIMANRFSKVVYRNLLCKRTPQMRRELHAYGHQMEGRGYDRDPTSYIFGYLGIHQREDLSTLFCSELVAAAYQRLGFLNRDKAPAAYFPADFSDQRHGVNCFGWHCAAATGGKIILQNGARLSREFEIDFTDSGGCHIIFFSILICF